MRSHPCSLKNYTECLPCDHDHGTCLSDGSCKCDDGYTGFDCSIQCSPCEHGDCQMDGTCLCRPGWSLADCSKHVGRDLVRSDFTFGDEGWRAYNNSCPGQLVDVRTSIMEEEAPTLIVRDRCLVESAAGQVGVFLGAICGSSKHMCWSAALFFLFYLTRGHGFAQYAGGALLGRAHGSTADARHAAEGHRGRNDVLSCAGKVFGEQTVHVQRYSQLGASHQHCDAGCCRSSCDQAHR